MTTETRFPEGPAVGAKKPPEQIKNQKPGFFIKL
jgi:hypothetical protein